MQAMADETDGNCANFSVALPCIGPSLSCLEVEFSRSGHIYAMLGDIGYVLVAIELNRQDLIVYTIKW